MKKFVKVVVSLVVFVLVATALCACNGSVCPNKDPNAAVSNLEKHGYSVRKEERDEYGITCVVMAQRESSGKYDFITIAYFESAAQADAFWVEHGDDVVQSAQEANGNVLADKQDNLYFIGTRTAVNDTNG